MASLRLRLCRCTPSTTTECSTSRSAMPTDIPPWTTRPPSITGSTPEPSPSIRRLAPTWRSSDASIRTREWSPRSTPPEKTGIPLRIAGIVQDEAYFEREVVPRLDGERVQFIGPVAAEDRSSFLGGAMALLHLIDFDEPFGLSVVEAMACGTPVIAFDRGSMSEIIIDGTTGFLVADVASAAEAIRRVESTRPADNSRRGPPTIQQRPHGRRVRRCLSTCTWQPDLEIEWG